MKLVVGVPKDILTDQNDDQYIEDKLVQNISNVISTTNSQVLNNTYKSDMVMISVVGSDTDRYSVWSEEYEGIQMRAQFDYVFVSVDYNLVITGSNDCFENFGCTPVSVLVDLRKISCENLNHL